jgi:hypothetical protein
MQETDSMTRVKQVARYIVDKDGNKVRAPPRVPESPALRMFGPSTSDLAPYIKKKKKAGKGKGKGKKAAKGEKDKKDASASSESSESEAEV